MDKDETMKASDVFKRTNHFFGGKNNFDKAFPQIEDIEVLVQESGFDVMDDGIQVYKKNQFSEYIDCSNTRCYNGGFSIGSIIRDMVRDKKVVFETSLNCKGYEGSPKGRKKFGVCENTFNIKVKIKYR